MDSANLIKILFLASDPSDASRLRLQQEYRDIEERLQLAKQRERFLLHPRLSVRVRDITQAIFDFAPQIIHFSGHGTSTGALCFEDETGKIQAVESEALAELFELVVDQVNCVVLNACYSETQAKAIAKYVPYVIGMKQAIGDQAAISFAVGFYKALGANRPIEEAYKFGRVEIRLQNIPEHLTPVLYPKKKVNPLGNDENLHGRKITLLLSEPTIPVSNVTSESLNNNIFEQKIGYNRSSVSKYQSGFATIFTAKNILLVSSAISLVGLVGYQVYRQLSQLTNTAPSHEPTLNQSTNVNPASSNDVTSSAKGVVPAQLGEPEQVQSSLISLPSGNYLFCSKPETAEGQESGVCFRFRKVEKRVVGNFYEPYTENGVCIDGTVNSNTVTGKGLEHLIELQEPIENTNKFEHQYNLVNWDESGYLKVGIVSAKNAGYSDAVDYTAWIYYGRAFLNLDGFYQYNAGTTIPPQACEAKL
jgi:hypothetical protein